MIKPLRMAFQIGIEGNYILLGTAICGWHGRKRKVLFGMQRGPSSLVLHLLAFTNMAKWPQSGHILALRDLFLLFDRHLKVADMVEGVAS